MKNKWLWIVIIALIALSIYTFYKFQGSTTSYVPVAGKVTIIEFGDFQCPSCGRVQPTVKQVKDAYGDRIIHIFKHFPLQFHQYAEKAAEASECSRDQGKFWEYHDILYAHQDALDLTSLKSYANYLGLDARKFNSCLDSGEKYNVVKKDFEDGVSMGVQGTPTFFINGELLSGAQPFENFKVVIDQKLAQ